MPKKSKFCPLVNAPTQGCYCAEISSANVESVIRFCMEDFHSCEIYQQEDPGGRGTLSEVRALSQSH